MAVADAFVDRGGALQRRSQSSNTLDAAPGASPHEPNGRAERLGVGVARTSLDVLRGRNGRLLTVVRDSLLQAVYHQRIAVHILLGNVGPAVALGLASYQLWTDGVTALPAFAHESLSGVPALLLFFLVFMYYCQHRLHRRLRMAPSVVVRRLCIVELACFACLNLQIYLDFQTTVCTNTSAFMCSQAYLFSAHIALSTKWVVSLLTGRIIFFPEVIRSAFFVAASCLLVARDGALTSPIALLLLVEGVASFFVTMVIIKYTRVLVFEDKHLPKVETSPQRRWFLVVRERIVHRLERLVESTVDEPVLESNTAAGVNAGAFLVCRFVFGTSSLLATSQTTTAIWLALLVTAFVSKFFGGTNTGLQATARRLGLSTRQRELTDLSARLCSLPNELAVLEGAASALLALLPDAAAIGAATLDRAGARLVTVEAGDDPCLAAALAKDGPFTSVAFAYAGRGAAWSVDFPSQLSAFTDWRAAESIGPVSEAVTAPLTTGAAVVGFCLVLWKANGCAVASRAKAEQLRELCEQVGSALAAVRAKAELQKSQSLVHDIYPEHIASALAERSRAFDHQLSEQRVSEHVVEEAGRRASLTRTVRTRADGSARGRDSVERGLIAEHFPDVSIIFCDIVGFTSLSQSREPAEVMRLLDSLFCRLDLLCATLDVFKVETIGDCYMAVAGMLPRRADHASVALRFAIAVLDAAHQVPTGDGDETLRLRVGVHTGSVTAGIIGSTRARYCLFGDTVNTASRMESLGNAGDVHVSGATATSCGLPLAWFDERELDVKGKGRMKTYLLKASKHGEAEHQLSR